MKIQTTSITPKFAQDLLVRNTRNRKISEAHVRRLSDEMTAGKWKLNGDSIRMNGNALVDGQHRLLACVKSGVAFDTLLITDVPADVFDTIDIGKRRSPGDTLSVLGYKYATLLASSLILTHHYMSSSMGYNRSCTNGFVEELAERYPSMQDSVKLAACEFKTRLTTPTTVAAMHNLMKKKDAELADEFFTSLAKGIGIEEGAPVGVLRERLLANSFEQKKHTRTYVCAIVIKAWNATREGRKLKACRYGENETFPIII
jgi:hypothetical protein